MRLIAASDDALAKDSLRVDLSGVPFHMTMFDRFANGDPSNRWVVDFGGGNAFAAYHGYAITDFTQFDPHFGTWHQGLLRHHRALHRRCHYVRWRPSLPDTRRRSVPGREW